MAADRSRRAGQHADLSREAVVAAALALLDEVGYRSFSVRKVAERLGVYDRAVHHHLGGRDDLLVAVADRVLADIEIPGADGIVWADWLRLMASSVRASLDRHPGAAPVVHDLILVAPGSARLSSAVLTVLLHADFALVAAVDGHNAFVSFLTGFTALDLPERLSAGAPVPGPHPVPDVTAELGLPAHEHLSGATEKVAAAFQPRRAPGVSDRDLAFAASLGVVIDGIAAAKESSREAEPFRPAPKRQPSVRSARAAVRAHPASVSAERQPDADGHGGRRG